MTTPITPAQFEGFGPGRLWSLWDMLRIFGERLVSAVGTLSAMRSHLQHIATPGPVQWKDVEKDLGHVREILSEMKMKASIRFLDQVIEYTKPGSVYPAQTARDAMDRLLQSMEAEMAGTLFLGVELALAPYYEDPEPFGRVVAEAYPASVSEDVVEAAKCLALERATAVVFHLGRAMEGVVQVLATKLAIANPDRVWGKLLSDIHAKIEAMPKGPLRDQWSESHVLLYHVKQAWRNDTMHPKQTYTECEALNIFRAVKVFMTHLSELL